MFAVRWKGFPALALAACAVLATARPGEAQKIAYVRSDVILDRSAAAQGALSQIRQEIEGWRREGAEMEKELSARLEEYQSQASMLSEDAKRQQEEQIARKKIALEEFGQRYFGQDGQAEKRRAEVLQPVQTAIFDAIKVVAQRSGYELVLDASGGTVVWVDAKLDLTDSVIEEMKATETSAPK
jgi:Skp family chaperone for outer membrane proteins